MLFPSKIEVHFFWRFPNFIILLLFVLYLIFFFYLFVSGHIYSLCQLSSHMFVSGSQDKTARFWDLRASAALTCVPSMEPGQSRFLFCSF